MLFSGVGREPGFEGREGFGQIATAVTKAKVSGFVVNSAGKEENSGLGHQLFAKRLNVLLGFEMGKANGAGIRSSPVEKIIMAGKEGGKLRKIAQNDLTAAVDQLLTVAEGQGSEEFAGGAGTDGGVMLE